MERVECPYCGENVKVKSEQLSIDDLHQSECYACNNTFVFETVILFDFNARKAPCLNGEEHDFKPTRTFPRVYTKMECSSCGENREPTEEEFKQIMKDYE